MADRSAATLLHNQNRFARVAHAAVAGVSHAVGGWVAHAAADMSCFHATDQTPCRLFLAVLTCPGSAIWRGVQRVRAVHPPSQLLGPPRVLWADDLAGIQQTVPVWPIVPRSPEFCGSRLPFNTDTGPNAAKDQDLYLDPFMNLD